MQATDLVSQSPASPAYILIKANKANASAAKRSRQESAQILFTILKMCCQSEPQDGQRGVTRGKIKGNLFNVKSYVRYLQYKLYLITNVGRRDALLLIQ